MNWKFTFFPKSQHIGLEHDILVVFNFRTCDYAFAHWYMSKKHDRTAQSFIDYLMTEHDATGRIVMTGEEFEKKYPDIIPTEA